jgi:hypothetical protein
MSERMTILIMVARSRWAFLLRAAMLYIIATEKVVP